jgi:fumarylacetoacetase
MIAANDPSLRSWIDVPAGSDFPIQNLPLGVFRTVSNPNPRVCTAVGDSVVDLSVLNYLSLLDELEIPTEVLRNRYLNDLMALGKPKTRALRNRLSELLREGNEEAKSLAWHFLHPMDKVELLLPVQVRDYTDFYSSIEHATNVGKMFRDPENALLPNWRHLPVGYHGRASSIVVSDVPVRRPMGQLMPDGSDKPMYGPSRLLDFELEMAFVVGKSTELGQRVSTTEAEDHIFGLMLFNDWSARDVQKWEYVPLGPFLAKSFASTAAPWLITLDALEPFRVKGPVQEPEVLPYLQYEGAKNYDLNLQVLIQPDGGKADVVCRSNFRYMYWNMCQQLAHHTVNGCNLSVGDMCASGTISGSTPDSYGSMLELTWRGSKPLKLSDGSERKFINDGDTVILRGYGERDGVRIGFGEARANVLPAE